MAVDFTRPADSLLPGLVPAHDARWAAVGKMSMSAPVSATITSASVADPGDGADQRAEGLKGSITTSIRVFSSSIWRVRWSIISRCIRARNAWWALNRPVERLGQLGDLDPEPPLGQVGERGEVDLAVRSGPAAWAVPTRR